MQLTHTIPTSQTNPIIQFNISPAITAIVKPFIGQKFSWVRVSYGDEIKLNFGNENIKKLKSGRVLKKGDWIFTTSASLWELHQNQQLIIDYTVFDGNSEKENESQLKNKFKLLADQKIQSIDLDIIPQGLKTTLRFTDGFIFTLIPHPNDPDLELWKLFMPTEQVLTLTNKVPFWSCRSIHDRY
jgi:hypothetical protein